jgi:hypothetical protein
MMTAVVETQKSKAEQAKAEANAFFLGTALIESTINVLKPTSTRTL